MTVEANLIAPCGMNCALCYAYQRHSKPCGGCREGGSNLPAHCRKCGARICMGRPVAEPFCGSCAQFPCKRLSQLDRRYRTNYGVSPVGNLKDIRERGTALFLEEEARRWVCPSCGALLCIHGPSCAACGFKRPL